MKSVLITTVVVIEFMKMKIRIMKTAGELMVVIKTEEGN